MKNAANAIRIGFKILAGVSAGYFVLKATDKKADELLDDGGMVNAFVIGAGQGALATVVGTLAYYTVG